MGFLVAAGIVAGVVAMQSQSLDAIPDLSDTQVIVYTDFPGQAPEIVENQVTWQVTTSMLSIPRAKTVRGFSYFGLSFVYVIFEDGTDIYWARSRVLEYLSALAGKLPAGASPRLGPDASGVGWVYQYALTSPTHTLAELRTLQDWYLRPQLASVPGVSEIASIGGFVKQYQVQVDPQRLAALRITLSMLQMALMNNNNDFGGKTIEMAETEYMVYVKGYLKGKKDIENVAVMTSSNGTSIRIGQVATVVEGPDMRRGAADYNGEGDTAGGIVVMRAGENARDVIQRVKQKLEGLREGLPKGVQVVPVYDRSQLIEHAVTNLRDDIIKEIIVVTLVCLLFLFHVRSAFVSVFTIPAGILLTFIAMRLFGINSDIMSLGGIIIAVGAMVDASVVMVENLHKHMERDGDRVDGTRRGHWELVKAASLEVGPSLFFSLLVITVSFLPVFALQGESGRLFKPLAYTKTFAMAGAALLSVTVIPILMGLFVRGKVRGERDNPVSLFFIKLYEPVIHSCLRHRGKTLLVAVGILIVTLWPLARLGSEFMPPLYEGDLLYMPTTQPNLSITKAREILQQTDKIIKQFPEVKSVFGKVGRAETATDPAPMTMLETIIQLKDRKDWRPGMTPDKLVEELNHHIQFPGLVNAWTMPIKTRVDMLSTGIRTPLGIKVLGKDLDTISDLAVRIEKSLKQLKTTRSVFAERVTGGNYVVVDLKREELGRYGVSVADVQKVLDSTIGGMPMTYTVEGAERYPVAIRYPSELREGLESLRQVLVGTMQGQVPLSQLADIRIEKGPMFVKSENARRNAWVYIDIQDIDIGTYVAQAKALVAKEVPMPEGYNLLWTGQFEQMEKAAAMLRYLVPVALLLIVLLLYLNFKSMKESLLILVSVPFGLVGGVWALAMLGYNLSVAVAVGFIALGGLVIQTGVLMHLFMDEAYKKRAAQGRVRTVADLNDAIVEGSVERVRPKLMTVSTMIFGLLPVMFASVFDSGADVMQRIAAPVIGGLFSSTIHILVVIPVIFSLTKEREMMRARTMRTTAPQVGPPPVPPVPPVPPGPEPPTRSRKRRPAKG